MDNIVSHHGSEREFQIRLGKTYYEQGFFNVPLASDALITEEECKLSLPNGIEIMARVDRNANRNKTARIFGRAALMHWFQENYNLDETVPAFIVDNANINLGECITPKVAINGHPAIPPTTRSISYLPGLSGLRS